MGNIGGEIVTGALSAIWHMLALVPVSMWLILIMGIVVVVFILRYATNWKVDVFFVVAMFLTCEGLALRQHWIDLGRTEMLAQVKAAQLQVEVYKETNLKVIACYQTDPAGHIWDRTVGKCLRRDGAVE